MVHYHTPIFQVFRRWEERVEGDRKQTYEVDYQLELQLEPEWTAQRNTWVQVSLGQSKFISD